MFLQVLDFLLIVGPKIWIYVVSFKGLLQKKKVFTIKRKEYMCARRERRKHNVTDNKTCTVTCKFEPIEETLQTVDILK